MNDGLIYLASPYTHADPAVREQRFRAACQAAAFLMGKGMHIFSPIAHTHPIAEFGLPKDWAFWQQYDRVFLQACSRLLVLTLKGWQQSTGVQAEIGIMAALGKPVDYMKLVEGRCQVHTRHRGNP
jgi:nucleoside 2-deoxyribosyltransferase